MFRLFLFHLTLPEELHSVNFQFAGLPSELYQLIEPQDTLALDVPT